MLNDYTEEYDYTVIKADGASKYGLNIIIDKDKLKEVDSVTDNYWNITTKDGMYYAYTVVNGKIIYLHELLGINRKDNGLINTKNDNDYSEYYPEFIKIIDDNYNDLKLIDILNSDDIDNKKDALLFFKNFLLSAKKDRLGHRAFNVDEYLKAIELYENNMLTSKKLNGLNSTIEDMCYDWNDLELSHKSEYILEGHIIFIYPKIKELIANKEHLCELGGFRIYKGETYYRCKLFIEDYTDNSIYSTREVSVSEDYLDYFPKTVHELNDFFFRVDNAYNVDDEDYYNIACNMGDTRFGLKLIKKKR